MKQDIDYYSPLHRARQQYVPRMPMVFADGIARITLTALPNSAPAALSNTQIPPLFPHTHQNSVLTCVPAANSKTRYPLRAGVILSGGQAPGGHSVICGLFDALKTFHPDSEIIGFIGGPSGLLNSTYKILTADIVHNYRHSGGFDIIGSGRTKIETEAQFAQALQVARTLDLNAILIIGGDDSNTNAALMAEYFKAHDAHTVVVGAPKTIDGDLRNAHIPISFGFDTATKTYSELIGNICRDANSAQKYWHFIKLMGRSASHIALECALQTHPNICIISEEVAAKRQTLKDVVNDIVEIVLKRAHVGQNYGVVLIPEGLIEFIDEIGTLIKALNELMAVHEEHFQTLNAFEDQAEFINRNLHMKHSYIFSALPTAIQRQLLLDRDPHGNVQVSRIDTEQLLIEMVTDSIQQLSAQSGTQVPFSAQHHFFGYEGRCAYPTNFDSDYCYTLGYAAALLMTEKRTGYMAVVSGLAAQNHAEWHAGAVPITMMMNMERRHGADKAVIEKGLVKLDGAAFRYFAQQRDRWALHSHYCSPGAIQYYGNAALCDAPPLSLTLQDTRTQT